MNISLNEIKEGHKVTVSMWGGGVRHGVVTGVYEEIKNGEPGIDYENADGEWWAYLRQVIAYT